VSLEGLSEEIGDHDASWTMNKVDVSACDAVLDEKNT
jgi:hypothetical protein